MLKLRMWSPTKWLEALKATTFNFKETIMLNPNSIDATITLGKDGRFHVIGPDGQSVRSYGRARDARRGLTRIFG